MERGKGWGCTPAVDVGLALEQVGHQLLVALRGRDVLPAARAAAPAESRRVTGPSSVTSHGPSHVTGRVMGPSSVTSHGPSHVTGRVTGPSSVTSHGPSHVTRQVAGPG